MTLTRIAEGLAVQLSLPVFRTYVCGGWDSKKHFLPHAIATVHIICMNTLQNTCIGQVWFLYFKVGQLSTQIYAYKLNFPISSTNMNFFPKSVGPGSRIKNGCESPDSLLPHTMCYSSINVLIFNPRLKWKKKYLYHHLRKREPS